MYTHRREKEKREEGEGERIEARHDRSASGKKEQGGSTEGNNQ